jgi:hypothetical protein
VRLADLAAANVLDDERERRKRQIQAVEHGEFDVSIAAHSLGPEAKAAVKQALLDHLARQLRQTEDRLEALDVVVDD